MTKVEINHAQSIKFKWITYEIFYLYKNILEYLVEEQNSSICENPLSSQYNLSLIVFKIISKYLSEFLILVTNSSVSTAEINWDEQENDESFSSSSSKVNSPMYRQAKVESSLNNHQMEAKMYAKFLKFMDKNAIQLYENVLTLCNKYSQTTILSISICSQIILFKNQQLQQRQSLNKVQTPTTDVSTNSLISIEQNLSKSLIDSIDKNNVLLDNYLIIDILLELYIKCSSFRYNLNECKSFHVYLLNCLNKCLESTEQKQQINSSERICNETNSTKYLEIILHLIFVYFYSNKKV